MSRYSIQFAAWLGKTSRLVLTAGVLAVLIPGLLLALGAVRDDDVHMCYVPGSGTVYRIGTPGLKDECTSPQHVAFTLNAQGPKGEKGDQGDPGPQGDKGDTGERGPAGGFSGLEVVDSDAVLVSASDTPHRATAHCPFGKIAIAGGYRAGPDARVIGSQPTENSFGWEATGHFVPGGAIAVAIIARAVCVDAPQP